MFSCHMFVLVISKHVRKHVANDPGCVCFPDVTLLRLAKDGLLTPQLRRDPFCHSRRNAPSPSSRSDVDRTARRRASHMSTIMTNVTVHECARLSPSAILPAHSRAASRVNT